jgi:murein DD-endopeptidase MepM/ murein hydrolase activator NlpD
MRRAHGAVRGGRVWWSLVASLAMLLSPGGTAEGGSQPRSKGTGSSKRPPRVESEQGLRHVVRPGDTLWSIARRHGVELEALVQANQLDTRHRVRVGERLVIPVNVAPRDYQEPPSPAEIVLTPPPRTDEIGFMWPLIDATVVSPFGARGRAWHGGIDLRADIGTPIRAAAPGLVIANGWEGGYGRVVKIWHHFDFMTVYAHNHENLVQVGDWVERGQVIATVGNTGRSTAPHLHFEIRSQGKKYDPRFWLPTIGGVDMASSASRPRDPLR